MHTDFAPVLQVLFHAALDAFRRPDGAGLSAGKLLEECQQSIEDPATILLKCFGKSIVQPRRDLFEKATSLQVFKSLASGFMTKNEADATMETAKQAELISVHDDRSAPRQAYLQEQEVRGARAMAKAMVAKGFPSPPPSAVAATVVVAAVAAVAAIAAATTATTTAGGISVGTSGELASPVEYPSPCRPRQRR